VQQSPINATQNQRGPRGAGRFGGRRVSRPVGGPAGQHGVHGHAWQEGLLQQQQGLGGRVLRHARQEGSVRGRVLRRPRQEVAGPRGRRRRGRPIVPDMYPVQDHRRTEIGTLRPG